MIQGYKYEFYQKAADYIAERIGNVPETGIILGTGCAPFASRISNRTVIPYEEIPGFPVTTNPDHAGEMVAGDIGGKYVICMNGRFHYYEGYSMEELNIPVHVLHVLGVKTLILTNAAGAVNPTYRPGDAMIISDHIKLFTGSPMRGPNNGELGPRFFSVADMYTEKLRITAKERAKRTSLRVHEGVYMFFPGPQFETRAEIRAAGILGADAVGMSTVTEALTAAHCAMEVLGISLITNMAAGLSQDEPAGSEINRIAEHAAPAFSAYLEDIVSSLK